MDFSPYSNSLEEQKLNNLYSQIKNYFDSQKLLKNFIENNVATELELYIINDIWLNQWKKYSCYDDIKFNSSLDKNKWKEIRQNSNADQYKVGPIDNKTLIQFDNTLLNTNLTFDLNANFHFVTKECYNKFSENNDNKNQIIKFKFISYNKKLIYQCYDKIFVLFKMNRYINFIIFNINNPNNTICFEDIKNSNMRKYLQDNGIIDVEKKQIQVNKNNFSYNVFYINKSFNSIKNKDKNFKELISSLINLDNNINLFLNSNKF